MEAWKDNLLDCIKAIEEAQRDNALDNSKRGELDEVVVRIQELIED